MTDDLYEGLGDGGTFPKKTILRKVYFEFLGDFKSYLTEFIRESSIDLTISQIEVSTTPQKLFWGEYGGMYITLKNQGNIECYLSTDKRGKYRLDPNEKDRIWLNKETIILTLSGTTTVGYIRN